MESKVNGSFVGHNKKMKIEYVHTPTSTHTHALTVDIHTIPKNLPLLIQILIHALLTKYIQPFIA